MTDAQPGNEFRIALTKGYFAIVDEADFERLNRSSWHASENAQGTVYAARRHMRGGPSIQMHREILGAEPGQYVDHRYGNTLDNRRANLRLCTSAENNWNRRRINAACGFKGVNYNNGTWRARITVAGKVLALGYFSTAEAAARAYDAAAVVHFGEFAATNEMLGLFAPRAA